METIIRELQSPAWWLTAVIAGLIINVAAAYLKPVCDSFLSKVSVTWRNRSQNAKAAHDAMVQRLREDKQQLLLCEIRGTRDSVLSLVFLVLCFSSVGTASLLREATEPDLYLICAMLFASVLGLVMTFILASKGGSLLAASREASKGPADTR